jgi:uncharacterized protein involved in response to NO
MNPIDIKAGGAQPQADDEPVYPPYQGPAVLSYGFRPFFLSAALFAGAAIPAWVLVFAGLGSAPFLYAPREWHVHEMLFGFLPAVMTGFLLTAVPNWTGRTPIRGLPLLWWWILWLAGRLLVAMPVTPPTMAAVLDGAFVVVIAAYVWREIARSGSWDRAPIGVLISGYAAANIWFHFLTYYGTATDAAERTAIMMVMLLLTLIGGRITPSFTEEYFQQHNVGPLPAASPLVDGPAIGMVLVAAVAWIVRPASAVTGALFLAAGTLNLIRLARWRGWMARQEPLVSILHVGYGWVALSLLALGGAVLGVGLPPANAVHVLTTGAVGTMTLGVMTRASLGHTGRPRRADALTVTMYGLVNLGAVLRVFAPAADASAAPATLMLGLASICWSGAYLLFAAVYGRFLIRPSLEEP